MKYNKKYILIIFFILSLTIGFTILNRSKFPSIKEEKSLKENDLDDQPLIAGDSGLFDGLYIEYDFTLFFENPIINYVVTYHAICNWAHHSGNIYNTTCIFSDPSEDSLPSPLEFSWNENNATRLIYNYKYDPAMGLLMSPNSHTFMWVFTNISLLNLVNLSIPGDNAPTDHIFNVTNEESINLGGSYGEIDTWYLEDTETSGYGNFEKYTGLLISGIFYLRVPHAFILGPLTFELSHCSVDFLDTNAIFGPPPPPPPPPKQISNSTLFDGLFADYDYSILSPIQADVELNVSWSFEAGMIFNVLANDKNEPLINYTWDVDNSTRELANYVDASVSIYIAESSHTPWWIFTNSSIGDHVWICVLNDTAQNDHEFLITGELIYNLPNYGLVEAWILEDQDASNGIAWYEKSTGLLLWGEFYGIGSDNYTLTLRYTNANFNILKIYRGVGGDDDDDDDGEEEFDFLGPTLIIIGSTSAIGVAGIALYLIRKKRLKLKREN